MNGWIVVSFYAVAGLAIVGWTAFQVRVFRRNMRELRAQEEELKRRQSDLQRRIRAQEMSRDIV